MSEPLAPCPSRMDRRQFLSGCFRCALLCAGSGLAGNAAFPAPSRAQEIQKGRKGLKLSPYFTPLSGGHVRCDLCPRQCETAHGERGHCRVRENRDGKYYSLVYGNPCAVHVDPIEKKPFFHVLPSTRSFSIATAGCNFNCKFCQNWEISQASPDDTMNYDLPPEALIRNAQQFQCESIASTYVEPTIFIEYMIEVGKLAKSAKILNTMHSNGYISPKPLDDLCDCLDAACIDLKGFTEDYYRELTGGSLAPVLETLQHLKARKVHTELVNLIVPGKNDDMTRIRTMCRWILKELGPDVPVHFTRFYPMYKLKSLEPTPVSVLENAWKAAREEGLNHAYIGNIPGHPAEDTICPRCKQTVIKRTGYSISSISLKDGSCGSCGQKIAGIWKPA
ncbi:MAG: AmmeMemoRadiSam system radical SAM enzyme [Desulfobacteraceae bacterium]|nr:AmmeMemoRadiSam system radical SAM enzyme [Desulfobacteraceae bacterium]